jgi:hypothetical protein
MGCGLNAQAFVRISLVCVLAMLSRPFHAQEIHVRVLNARSGKPITNECLNVWARPPVRGTALVAPADANGIVVLHFENGQVTADPVPANPCNRTADVGPKPFPKEVGGIIVFGDIYIACQEYGKILPGALTNPTDTMPSYSIEKIVKSGVAASNTCGKFRAEAKPGELILFVRPRTWWEWMRQ